MSLNPNTPTLVGRETLPLWLRGLAIAKNRQWAARYTPGAITADDVRIRTRNTVLAPVIQVDIVPEASLVPGAITTTIYRPNADGVVTGVVHNGGGAAAPFYVDVDETVLDVTDYNLLQTTSAIALFEYGTAAFAGRPVGVTYRAIVENVSGGIAIVIPRLSIGGISFDAPAITLPVGQSTIAYTWLYNPATKAEWTAAEIQAFDAGQYAGLNNASSITNLVRVYQEWLSVDSVAEARLATGHYTPTPGGDVWDLVTLASPAGVDTHTYAAAPTSYLMVLSNPSGIGSTSWVAFDAGAPDADIGSAPVTFDTNRLPSALGATDNAAPGFMLLNATGKAIYGQPIVEIDEEPVYAGHVLQQEVTLPDVQSRGWLAFGACLQSAATTAPLIARLKRRDTGAQIGGDVTVTVCDVRDAPQLMQRVAKAMASAGAGIVGQCYVEWSTTGADGFGWLVARVGTGESGSTESLSTDDRTFEGGVGDWTGGSCAAIAQQNGVGVGATWGGQAREACGTTGQREVSISAGVVAVTGGRVSLSGQVKAPANARTFRLGIRFWDVANALISTVYGTDIVTSTGAYQTVSVDAGPPANAVWVGPVAQADGVTAFENWAWLDSFSMLQGPASQGLTIGGGTDIATIAGVDEPNSDFPVVVGIAIAGPTNLHVTAQDDHNLLTWDHSNLLAAYAATYITRWDEDLGCWLDIAVAVVEGTATFRDYEARRGLDEQYVLQAETVLGERSIPLTPKSGTVLASCFEIVSNEDPTINRAFQIDQQISVDLPQRAEVVTNEGRDTHRIFRGSEDLGEVWNQIVNVAGAAGPALWRPLVAIMERRDLTYVCVLDPWGDRWFIGFIPGHFSSTSLWVGSGKISAVQYETQRVPSVVEF